MAIKNNSKSFYLFSFVILLLFLFSAACGGTPSAPPAVSEASSGQIAAPDNAPSQPANDPATAVTAKIKEAPAASDSSDNPPDAAGNLPTLDLPVGIEIVGTIEATIDGRAKTWYVLHEDNCHWGATIATTQVSLIGYEDPTAVDFGKFDYNGNPSARVWQQPKDLGGSRFIIEFDNPTPLAGNGGIDLHSLPRGDAHVGDGIFMSYTSAAGDFIHGVSTVQGAFTDNGDGTFSLDGRLTTSEFAERDSAGLTTLPGMEDGRFTVTNAILLNADLITEWFTNCQ